MALSRQLLAEPLRSIARIDDDRSLTRLDRTKMSLTHN